MKVETERRKKEESLSGSMTYTCSNNIGFFSCENATWSNIACNAFSTNTMTFRGRDSEDILKFDYDKEKIIINGEDATLNDKAIAMACRKFLFEMIKQQKG